MGDLLTLSTDPINLTPTQLSYLIVFVVMGASTFLTVLEIFFAVPQRKNGTFAYLQSALMIESAVNCIATYFYYFFLAKSLSTNEAGIANFTRGLRSIDWLVTTPLMIGSLMYYYKYNDEQCQTLLFTSKKTPKHQFSVPVILALTMLMILSGSEYIGQWAEEPMKRTATNLGLLISWACFGGIVYLLYENFYKQSKTKHKQIVSWWFLSVWASYGIVRHLEILDGSSYQITYNFLDLLSKGGFGAILWFITQHIQAEGCIGV